MTGALYAPGQCITKLQNAHGENPNVHVKKQQIAVSQNVRGTFAPAVVIVEQLSLAVSGFLPVHYPQKQDLDQLCSRDCGL